MPRYSAVLMDHFNSPRNVGRMKNPDVVGQSGSPGRPPFMIMHFRLDGGVVKEVRFKTFGCGPAIAAGSLLSEMITNRNIAECLAVTEQQLIDALALPADKTWCAKLALTTVHSALTKVNDESG